MIKAAVGEAVKPGDVILELRYRERVRLETALPLVTRAIRVEPEPPPAKPLILEEVL